MVHFIENSKWFHQESKKFVGYKKGDKYVFKFKDVLRYPIAYIDFMWSMHKGR